MAATERWPRPSPSAWAAISATLTGSPSPTGLTPPAPPSALVPIGPGCKVCDRDTCPQRAFPAIGKPLDANPDHSSFIPYATEDSVAGLSRGQGLTGHHSAAHTGVPGTSAHLRHT